MLVFNQPCLLMLVLSTWIRSERNQIIWMLFTHLVLFFPLSLSPGHWSRKSGSDKSLDLSEWISELGRELRRHEWFHRGICPALPCGSLEVCRISKTQGEEFIISYFQPLWPNPTLVSSEIHFLFCLFTGLNNQIALGDIFKPYIVINYPWIWKHWWGQQSNA